MAQGPTETCLLVIPQTVPTLQPWLRSVLSECFLADHENELDAAPVVRLLYARLFFYICFHVCVQVFSEPLINSSQVL